MGSLLCFPGERPFVCSICKKAFNQKNALQIHMKKHNGDRPHKCPYCTMSFTQKGNLKTHIKRAHHMDMVQSMNIAVKAGDQAGSISEDEVRPEDGIDLEGVVTELFAH